MCWPHFNIVFFLWGGGGGGSILSEPGCRGKYSKIIHTTCIFLTFLSKTVDRYTPSNRLWFFSFHP